ncbi:MAG: hypothetical protein F4X13_04135 [Gammaproteobacteria bacterium]|nr:hypothetical protein [Gammaproteobacteria bacterium]MDE0259472.1 hypothetical protein [Gammaproteobacteria bacterium]MYC98440.1 hypothetical protein [Gammaproteobacteria bacterium]
MKAWTLTAAALAATLTLAGCAEDAPGVAAVPEPEPGDPAIYAPDGWPLQIGDRISGAEQTRLYYEGFDVWKWALALNLVGDRVYAALIENDPTKLGDYPYVYRGHFPIRFPDWIRDEEPYLASKYHGKIEYYPTPPPPPVDYAKRNVVVLDPGMFGPDGRIQKLDPNHVPDSPDPLMWPDYPERRK